jgi:hypothetical protein
MVVPWVAEKAGDWAVLLAVSTAAWRVVMWVAVTADR